METITALIFVFHFRKDSSDEDETSDEEKSEEDDDDDDESEVSETSSEERQSPATSDDEPDPKPEKNNLDLLLDLDFNETGPVMTPSIGGFLSPLTNNKIEEPSDSIIQTISPKFVPQTTSELLNRIKGNGLSITYRFTRSPHLFSPQMVSVEVVFTNSSNDEILDIRVGKKNLPVGVVIHDFANIAILTPQISLPGTLGINFNDSPQPISFEIVSSIGKLIPHSISDCGNII